MMLSGISVRRSTWGWEFDFPVERFSRPGRAVFVYPFHGRAEQMFEEIARRIQGKGSRD